MSCMRMQYVVSFTGICPHILNDLAQVHVFQSFPFLDQARQAFLSARTFVRDVLCPLQSDVSRKLQGETEERLAKEIDNETAQVVRGDGSESQSPKDAISPKRPQAIVPRTAAAKEYGESEEGSSSQDEDPSWVLPAPYPSPPLSTDTEEDEPVQRKELSRTNTAKSTSSIRSTTSTRSSTSARTRAASLTSSSFWSPLSSLSSLPSLPLSDSSRASSSSASSSLRRVKSRQYLPADDAAGARPPTREYRLPAVSISSSTSAAPPRPSIRRSHSSHPDITSLCAQWADTGPANRTLTYKPDTLPRRRKHSSSVSTVASGQR